MSIPLNAIRAGVGGGGFAYSIEGAGGGGGSLPDSTSKDDREVIVGKTEAAWMSESGDGIGGGLHLGGTTAGNEYTFEQFFTHCTGCGRRLRRMHTTAAKIFIVGGKSRGVDGSAARGSRKVLGRGVGGDGWDSGQDSPSPADIPWWVVEHKYGTYAYSAVRSHPQVLGSKMVTG